MFLLLFAKCTYKNLLRMITASVGVHKLILLSADRILRVQLWSHVKGGEEVS